MSLPVFITDPAVIWEDESLLIVNKPAGLLSIHDGYHPELPNLLNILTQEFGKLWVIHRLDKETSGILIFGRTPEAHRALNELFRKRLVKKTYHAVSRHSPPWDVNDCHVPLLVNGDRQHRTVVDEKRGKPAVTYFYVHKRSRAGCLLEAQPVTGYTHQIRAHCLYLGVPILGDRLYSFPADKSESQEGRLALHAKDIVFEHPTTGQSLSLSTPYPLDFLALLERLG